VGSGRQLVAAYQNLHGIRMYHRDPSFRALHDRSHVLIDGLPLVMWGKLLGYPLRRRHRVTWVDWLPRLLAHAAERQWSVYYLGAGPGVAEQGAAVFRERLPDLELRTHHGYFDPEGEENDRVVADINDWTTDILLVGMGMPRQEQWLLENLDRLRPPAVFTCGAAIEYFAGTMPQPPRWMGPVGLEWLRRLLAEPGRLWKRYLLEPWSLLPHAVRDIRERLHGG
jgi:N-acetylglucosaminyldiphosphoundecaprenol N-acetyl-beta-D-mannosaminyltransferase